MKYLFLVLFLTACAGPEQSNDLKVSEGPLACEALKPCLESDDGLTCKDSCGRKSTFILCTTEEMGFQRSKKMSPVYYRANGMGEIYLDPSDMSDCDFFLLGNTYIKK